MLSFFLTLYCLSHSYCSSLSTYAFPHVDASCHFPARSCVFSSFFRRLSYPTTSRFPLQLFPPLFFQLFLPARFLVFFGTHVLSDMFFYDKSRCSMSCSPSTRSINHAGCSIKRTIFPFTSMSGRVMCCVLICTTFPISPVLSLIVLPSFI